MKTHASKCGPGRLFYVKFVENNINTDLPSTTSFATVNIGSSPSFVIASIKNNYFLCGPNWDTIGRLNMG